MGKISTIEKDFSDILEDIASGLSILKACRERGISKQTFFDYIDADQEKKDQYMRAREQRGEECISRIAEYEEDLKAKKIDSATARVLIDTEKWLACKFYPKMYGEKQAVELTGANGSPLTPPVINIQPVKALNETESDNS